MTEKMHDIMMLFLNDCIRQGKLDTKDAPNFGEYYLSLLPLYDNTLKSALELDVELNTKQ